MNPKHVSAIFKKNIKNHFTVLKLIDRESQKFWNETKVAVKDEYEKKVPETKNRRKETGCQKNSKNWQEDKKNKNLRKELAKNFTGL